MIKLIPITSHPELVSEIVYQFSFMKLMSEASDRHHLELSALNIDDVYRKADLYFIDFTDDLGMIMTEDHDIKTKLTEFLKEWHEIVDVTAIQQNVHYRLSVMDNEI